MYRKLAVKIYEPEVIKKVDWLRMEGINMTDLITKALMEYPKEETKEIKNI